MYFNNINIYSLRMFQSKKIHSLFLFEEKAYLNIEHILIKISKEHTL